MIDAKKIEDIFRNIILNHLYKHDEIPKSLEQMIVASSLRLMDSKMIIEDSMQLNFNKDKPIFQLKLPPFSNTEKFFEFYNQIENEGLGKHFEKFTIQLSFILLTLCASEKQSKLVMDWARSGISGGFFLTDKGGPTLESWLSEYSERDNNCFQLTIDKIWGLCNEQLGFGVFAVRKKGSMTPALFLVSPESCAYLNKSSVGKPFLDGNAQLHNIRGITSVYKDDQMTQGGLTAAKQFLTLARPRFVLGVISHLYWLNKNKRLSLDNKHLEIIESIKSICKKILIGDIWKSTLVDDVLSIKFIFNELLLNLVVNGVVVNIHDQRDLLALSKMEGSSYRCLYELYTKDMRILS